MKSFDTVFLDLDGTITDSAPGILASVRYALRKYQEDSPREYTDAELNFFIGPPLVDSFEKLLSCSHDDALKCLAWYRQFYTGQIQGAALPGMLMNSVYPGIPELLGRLRKAGVKIVLATAKPEVYARRILEHYDLAKFFDFIHGATLEESRNKKHQVIAWALAHSGDVGRVVMVGDRENDITGAKVNGLSSIGVLWGYGSEAELREAGADMICAKVEDFFRSALENPSLWANLKNIAIALPAANRSAK